MGPFADTLFALLLGWLQAAAQGLWQLVTGADAAAWFQWVLENWLALAILLCIGGLAIDLMVYLLRWQPWRVWRSFLARFRHEEDEAETPTQATYRQWMYADGSMRIEELPRQEETPVQEPSAELPAPIRRVRRAPQAASKEQAYNQPYYPPQWRREDNP